MIKKSIKNIFRSGGYVIKKLPVDNIEENLLELFQALDINCVMDVGAHYGEYAESLRRMGYKNRIVSFEPVKASHHLLSRKAEADHDWITCNVALGRENSSTEINVANSSVFASFLTPTAYSREEFGDSSDTARKELVKIVTMDSIFKECVEGISDPRIFLKLDTQGFDLEVAGGASSSLKYISGIQSEVSVKKIYEGMPDWTTAIGFYKSIGYEVTGLYPVSRDKNMLVVEFDCVLRKIDH